MQMFFPVKRISMDILYKIKTPLEYNIHFFVDEIKCNTVFNSAEKKMTGKRNLYIWNKIMRLLFNAKWAIFQLYHDENNFHFDKMMMSTLF